MCSKILNVLFALCSIMNALIMMLELSNKREFLPFLLKVLQMLCTIRDFGLLFFVKLRGKSP